MSKDEVSKEEELDEVPQIPLLRVLAIVVSFFIAGALVLGGLLWLTSDKDNDAPQRQTFSLSESDKQGIEALTRNFVSQDGNFGMNFSGLSNNNVYNISRIVRNDSTNTQNYYLTRSSAYTKLRYNTNYIAEKSPLDYNDSDVSGWSVPEEKQQLMGYSISNITVNMPKDGYVMQGGNNSQAVDVEVSYDSTVDKIVQTKNDTTWDGSFNHLQKTFPRVTMKMTVSKVGTDWKAYNITSNSSPFTLATFTNPSYDQIGESMFGFDNVGVYKPDVSPQLEKNKDG